MCTVERNIQKICATWTVKSGYLDITSDIIKAELFSRMKKYLSNFVEYDFTDDINGNRTYTATLYVATGDKRYEH